MQFEEHCTPRTLHSPMRCASHQSAVAAAEMVVVAAIKQRASRSRPAIGRAMNAVLRPGRGTLSAACMWLHAAD